MGKATQFELIAFFALHFIRLRKLHISLMLIAHVINVVLDKSVEQFH